MPLETKLAVLDELFPARRQSPALREHGNGNRGASLPGLRGGVSGGGGVVDLPRVCAVHDKPYVARYVMGADGRFRHAQTIKVTRALWRGQYEGNQNRCVVHSADIDDESCAWCGAHARGAVLCPECNAEVCRGRTVDNYFRCRASCQNEGMMVTGARTHEGLRPEIGGE
jgi:hypothetical protein